MNSSQEKKTKKMMMMEAEKRNNSQMKMNRRANHYLCSGVRKAFISGAIRRILGKFIKLKMTSCEIYLPTFYFSLYNNLA